MQLHACRPRDPLTIVAPATARIPIVLFALVLATVAGAAAPASAQGPPHPLLNVHASVQPPSTCKFSFDTDTFVAASGFSQQVGVGGDVCESSFGWSYGTSTAQASPKQLRTLRAALAANHVGLHGGACVLATQFIFGGSYEITWYGSNLRRTDLTVYLDGAPSPGFPPCPAEVCEILQAFLVFQDEVFHESAFIGNCPAPP